MASGAGTPGGVKILWYLQSTDGPVPWEADGGWHSRLPELRSQAEAVDRAGFYGALLPTSTYEPLALAATLAPLTRRMRFLAAVYPGLVTPTKLVELARSIDNFSAGRLLFNVVNGHDAWLPEFGMHLAHDERYAYSFEYWDAFGRKYQDRAQGYDGEHIRLTPRVFDIPLVYEPEPVQPHIPLWGAGASPAGIDHAARLVDLYLSFADTPARLGERFARVRAAAAGHGRTLDRFGTRLQVIVRDTEDEAWAHAQWLLDRTSVETATRLASWGLGPDGLDTEVTAEDPKVHRRIEALRAGRRPDLDDLVVAPNLWVGPSYFGFDVLGPGPGTWLVGSPTQVADRIRDYRAHGAEAFILSGWPLVPEAVRFARDVLPLLAGDLDHGFEVPAHVEGRYDDLLALVPDLGDRPVRAPAAVR